MPFKLHSDSGDGGGGAASDAHDFIDNKLITFITSSTLFPTAADRWTLEREDVVVTDAESEFFLSPPTNAPDAPIVTFHTVAAGDAAIPDTNGQSPENFGAIYMFAGTSYGVSDESYAQPGNTLQHPDSVSSNPGWRDTTHDRHECSWANSLSGTSWTSHWLFAPSDGKYCYGVFQTAARRYRHVMFGQFEKFASAMNGGAFFGIEYWGQATADIDLPYDTTNPFGSPIIPYNSSLGGSSQAAYFRAEGLRGSGTAPNAIWHQNGGGFGGNAFPRVNAARPTTGTWDTANNAAIDAGRGCCTALTQGPGTGFMFAMQPSTLSGLKPLMPLTLWGLGRADGTDKWMPIGQMPDIYAFNMKGFSPGEEITFGGDTYVLFPIVNNDTVNTNADEEYSGHSGFAIRKRV